MSLDKDAAYYKSVVLSVLSVCLGFAFFNVSDAIIKEIGSNFHFSQILIIVYSVMFLFMAIYGWKTEGKRAFKAKKKKAITAYSLLMMLSVFLNIKALPNMQLTTFYTIIFISPLWVALLSSYFLKDKLTKERLGAIIFGFLVIVSIFKPWNGEFDIWAVIVFINSFICASELVILRYIGNSESRSYIMMCSAFWAIFISSFFLFGNYIAPSLYEWGLFLSAGVVLTIAALCMIYGFQNTPSATLVAPYHYTQIVWGALIGYFIFNEVPDIDTMVGATLIIFSGLYLIYSERKISKRKSNI